jgi:hypothetical protein
MDSLSVYEHNRLRSKGIHIPWQPLRIGRRGSPGGSRSVPPPQTLPFSSAAPRTCNSLSSPADDRRITPV